MKEKEGERERERERGIKRIDDYTTLNSHMNIKAFTSNFY